VPARAQPDGTVVCLTGMTTVSTHGRSGRDGRVGRKTGDSVDVMAEVFSGQYSSLVRLAAMLLEDAHGAEDVVQEAYVRVAARHGRLRDPHNALAYLRQTVVNLSRNTIRRRVLARRHSTFSVRDTPSAEDGAIESFERQAVIRGLRALPRRHRETLVLRYYLDFTVEQTAQTLGLSTGAVKSYTSRGLQQLRERIEEEESL
jgi:RNA polymerase sigma-70 factor (sigma-E family)